MNKARTHEPKRVAVARSRASLSPAAASPVQAAPAPPAAVPTAPEGEAKPLVTLPIVGIGASAGGLAMFEEFFAHMPHDSESGTAFVIVQHLDPHHKSILAELVRRYTRMQVLEAADGMMVEPNHTYIIPPNKDLALVQGRLQLLEPSSARGLRLPIDFFFRSLAQDRGEQAICIVLSGNGTDGTLGLRAIKEAGGMAMVQDPHSAEYDGMPRSAIATGLADYILAPGKMPEQLIQYVKHIFAHKVGGAAPAPLDVSNWLLKIMALLRTHSGHDFSNYKQSTILRRVERRMAVNQIDRIDHYVRHLRQHPTEIDVLFRELLIGVTGFFRDPEAFLVIQEQVFPRLFIDRPTGAPVRIWVPGCSTGEEAYSLAMLVQEQAEKLDRDFSVQIFATDIDHEAIDKARSAVYPASIVADVSPERLGRFFTQEQGDFYRVKKNLRDQLVFAEQDVIKDPPFSKLDLISCRNVLIYMEPVLQKKLLPMFHYALNPGGFLFLGNSESIGDFGEIFATVDRKWKVYQRKEGGYARPIAMELPTVPVAGAAGPSTGLLRALKEAKPSIGELSERALLQNYAPACVTVNERGEILYVHGRTGKYLELASGEMTVNLVRTAREGLKLELANALRKATTQRKSVRYEGLQVRANGGAQRMNLTVQPMDGPTDGQRLFLVTFQDVAAVAEAPRVRAKGAKRRSDRSERDRHIVALERELRVKEETLQTTVEELETSNEELKSTNEELQSTNEELQSTNKELETSKEELQSVNEELVTVNTELQQKIDGLSRANNDMNNLLASTGIGTLFVDHQQRIQRFTPSATKIINLIQTDIGRPVGHLVTNLVGAEHLGEDVRAVLDTLMPREAEVRSREGRWYLQRILPYRTMENTIEGVVVTFVDVTRQKTAEDEIRKLTTSLEQRVQERTSELMRLNQELQREVEERKRAEARRAALTSLHELSTKLTSEEALPALLQGVVETATEVAGAPMGTLQLYDASEERLRLVAHRGFQTPFLNHFAVVRDDPSVCGEAMRRGERVIVEDVAESTIFRDTPTLPVLEAAGVAAVQSTPLIGRDGKLLGMFSTHWTQSHQPDADTLRLLDLLARQAADLIEHRQREEHRQES